MKSFDEEAVLEAAMNEFWRHGYESVSVADLVEALGVSRSSLYATFGSKDELFVQALRRYDTLFRQQWMAEVADRCAPLESIRTVFTEVIEAPDTTRHLGCLLVNTTSEPVPAAASVIARDAFRSTQTFFAGQLEAARSGGGLPDDTDTTALAAALVALLLGLRVLTRTQLATAELRPLLTQVDLLLAA